MPFLRSRPELLRAFREGDRDALSQVYWAYIGRVESFVRHAMPWGRSEVVDVVQDAFIRAFDAKARLAYDGLRDYGPYLSTICRNLVTDRARRRGREVSTEDFPIADTPDKGPPSDDGAPWSDPKTM